MKQNRWMAILLAATLLVTACKNNFLNEYPEGQLNEGNFFISTDDFKQALTGAYVPLRGAINPTRGTYEAGSGINNIAFFMDEMRSDNTHYDYNAKDRGGAGYEQLADFMDEATNGVVASRYQAAYVGISRTNVILDRIAAISFQMDEADRKMITGEAKALRAHYYFDLVRHYGAVPLHLHEVKAVSDAFLPRTGADTVYAQIIQDFTDALALLGPPAGFPQSGHVTKGMAATELALVYITRKRFADAVPLLQSVTQMGYDLLPDYASIFTPANENSRESIFEIQYKEGTEGLQGNLIYRFIPVTPDTKAILDISYNNSDGGWNVPSDDMMAAYELNDKRMDASVAIAEGRLDANADFVPEKIVSVVNYPGPPAGKVAKRFIRKYLHPPYTTVNNTGDNWPVFRYADVLLMLAECLNEGGAAAEALPHLNRVRARAGLPAVTTTDQAQLRAIIAHERRIELAFENHRWLDLVRTEQAIPVITAYGAYMKAHYGYLHPSSYNVNNNRLVYAIPFREMQYNKQLVQNNGY
ncbi:RagB/SusD family nutrient uptake outer membrane protein [Chitinophaga alhagiae]|uniref:RagB/SusD family nutrient uptake outer membrane protein n=1 Tax=Chitinophaga alhagiae TaxID=2203219 RepID=A0ABN5LX30_9BACT|nr:RagB/SusD family nutrient uptake outer membrane protein [Chitinophaga alhagiae]AWO02308.1 RagB/SusD family nutrient uptake outer membrane protein [Chitinophaga alhagiae]